MPQMLIVHPTDLRAASEGAFDHALKLGLAERCRLALVHADGGADEAHDFDSFPRVRETLARWGLLADGAPKSAVADQLGLSVVKEEISAGDRKAALVNLLRNEEANLLVLGTRGLQGLRRVFEGSFSEPLARSARLPTLFVPNDADGFVDWRDGSVRLRNVLIPMARDPDGSGALTAALWLNDLLGQKAQFHVLHVTPPGSDSAHELDRWAAGGIVRQGAVVDTIIKVADEVDADLIVMATAGHKDFMDALRGSTTEEVLRRARRVLLAVPAD
jgi:nucleotide-binding universal stress UspA family protein